MNREHDPEPERYYDWMLWKMRQEDKAAKVVSQEDLYKMEIAEMQKEIHTLRMRVKELNDAVLQLQERKNG